MRTVAQLLLLSTLLAGVGCGGLLSQSLAVQNAVEAENYDVASVSVAKADGKKTVTVYMNSKFDDDDAEKIKAKTRETIPDATKVKVKKASDRPKDPEPTSTKKPVKS